MRSLSMFFNRDIVTDAVTRDDYIFGLGGRDIFPKDIEKVFEDLEEIKKTGKVESLVNYLGVRD